MIWKTDSAKARYMMIFIGCTYSSFVKRIRTPKRDAMVELENSSAKNQLSALYASVSWYQTP